MSPPTLAAICERARSELTTLGEAGAPLVSLLSVVQRAGAGRDCAALDDPDFALDVLAAVGEETDIALVGRVLDFLRARSETNHTAQTSGPSAPPMSLADAVTSYEAGALAMMPNSSAATYRTWTRRLVASHAEAAPREITAGDLTDLIAAHVVAARRDDERRVSGACAHEHAVSAFRHLWRYLKQKGWVTENVAMDLTKPPRPDSRRRDIRPDEAALVRHLAISTSRDPLLDEVTLTIPERLGLRSIELCRLRLCDLDLSELVMRVWGKGDKERVMPLPPALAELLERYVEDRRPAHVTARQWLASDERLLRRLPTSAWPLGRPAGKRRLQDLYARLHGLAPEVFGPGDVSLHSYRHAVGTFVDDHFGRGVTRAVLGHTSRSSPTDVYVHVSLERRAEALCAYEQHLLAAEPGNHRGAMAA